MNGASSIGIEQSVGSYNRRLSRITAISTIDLTFGDL